MCGAPRAVVKGTKSASRGFQHTSLTASFRNLWLAGQLSRSYFIEILPSLLSFFLPMLFFEKVLFFIGFTKVFTNLVLRTHHESGAKSAPKTRSGEPRNAQECTGRSQLESKRGLSGVGEGPGGQFERPENDPRRFQEVLDVVLGLLGGSGVRSGSKRLFEEGLRP